MSSEMLNGTYSQRVCLEPVLNEQ